MLPDPVSRSSERRAMRDEKIDELCMEHVALKAILGEMHIENDDLRARCARLRAALAGVMCPSNTAHADDLSVLGMLIDKVREDTVYYSDVGRKQIIAALEVLRETAEGKES